MYNSFSASRSLGIIVTTYIRFLNWIYTYYYAEHVKRFIMLFKSWCIIWLYCVSWEIYSLKINEMRTEGYIINGSEWPFQKIHMVGVSLVHFTEGLWVHYLNLQNKNACYMGKLTQYFNKTNFHKVLNISGMNPYLQLYGSWLAVEGSHPGTAPTTTCSRTADEENTLSWWAVDFGQRVAVSQIKVFLDGDCGLYRLLFYQLDLCYNILLQYSL